MAEHLAQGRWKELDDVFWTIIPFGTGGRRGKMYPIGSNAINDRTIGESAQGLADYVKRVASQAALWPARSPTTRGTSRAILPSCAAEVMVAAGFTVYFLDGYRSTPELSFAVRHQPVFVRHHGHGQPQSAQRQCGESLLVDRRTTVAAARSRRDRLRDVDDHDPSHCHSPRRLADGQDRDVPGRSRSGVHRRGRMRKAFAGPAELKIIYSPLHGVGASAVLPALAADGFEDVEMFGPHAEPNGDFPNVPGHVSNPENSAVFDAIIVRGQQVERRLDSGQRSRLRPHRPGRAVDNETDGPWATMTGNQIGAC